MRSVPVVFNAILFAILLVLPVVEARWNWPLYLKRLAANTPNARLRHFRSLLLWEWALALSFLLSWAASGRPWASMVTGHASAIQTWLCLLFAGLSIVVFWRQRRSILARPQSMVRLRDRLDYAKPLLPHTQAERKLFWLVSVTAGLCEETLYRGFLTWYIAGWTGPWAAIVLSSLIFGLGHVYLGLAHVPRTFLVGLVLAVLAYFSGSLWPSIVIHAAMDWNAGELGYALLSKPRDTAAATETVGGA